MTTSTTPAPKRSVDSGPFVPAEITTLYPLEAKERVAVDALLAGRADDSAQSPSSDPQA